MVGSSQDNHLLWLAEKALAAKKRFEQKQIELQARQIELEELRRDQELLDGALNALRREMGLPAEAPGDVHLRDMSLADALAVVLRAKKDGMKVTELIGELHAKGKKFGGKSPYAVLINTLNRSAKFAKVMPGVYRLAEDE